VNRYQVPSEVAGQLKEAIKTRVCTAFEFWKKESMSLEALPFLEHIEVVEISTNKKVFNAEKLKKLNDPGAGK
jgi:hypothetical protein